MIAQSIEFPVLRINDLTKVFDSTPVVQDLSLDVRQGEVLCMLGPSGCGKTTTLRMIAGFVSPTRGEVLIKGQRVTRMPPYRRDTGLVFQNYALFPHLTVAENVAFGLRNTGVRVSDRRVRVDEILDMVQLTGLGTRLPRELSGGQQQRVALARALAIRPAVLLLDEPFSNLDAKLRIRMREDMKALIRNLRMTTVFVTHDQEEALALADRIVVMQFGRVEQLGTPSEIYEAPANRFVAEFIGLGNFLSGRVIKVLTKTVLVQTEGGLDIVAERFPPGATVGDRVTVGIRPEAIQLGALDETAPNAFTGLIKSATYLGAVTRYRIALQREEILAEIHAKGSTTLTPGQDVVARWSPTETMVLA